jgi:cytochrome oxidase assembly protein ShyY1
VASSTSRRRSPTAVALITLAAVALCVVAGLWQYDRHEARLAEQAAAEAARDGEPIDLPTAQADPEAAELRRVALTGTWVQDDDLVLRLRPVEGTRGWHILTPFLTSSGQSVLIDRGFVAQTPGQEASPEALPTPTAGEVNIVGRVRTDETGPLGLDESGLSIRAVNLTEAATVLDRSLASVWLELVSQDPPASEPPTLIPEPELGGGRSLIYAVQWFIFAVVAVVGGVLLARSESQTASRYPAAPST